MQNFESVFWAFWLHQLDFSSLKMKNRIPASCQYKEFCIHSNFLCQRYLLQFDRNDFLKVNKAFWRAHFFQIWTICLVWLNWNSSERSIKATSMSLTIWIGRKAKNKSEFGQPKINNSWIRFSFAIHLMRIGAILLLSTFLKSLMNDSAEFLRSLKAFLLVEKIRCIFAKWKHKMTHSWGSMNLDKNVWMESSWFAE